MQRGLILFEVHKSPKAPETGRKSAVSGEFHRKMLDPDRSGVYNGWRIMSTDILLR